MPEGRPSPRRQALLRPAGQGGRGPLHLEGGGHRRGAGRGDGGDQEGDRGRHGEARPQDAQVPLLQLEQAGPEAGYEFRTAR